MVWALVLQPLQGSRPFSDDMSLAHPTVVWAVVLQPPTLFLCQLTLSSLRKRAERAFASLYGSVFSSCGGFGKSFIEIAAA